MKLTNAQKQARFRANRKKKGLVELRQWVTPEQKKLWESIINRETIPVD